MPICLRQLLQFSDRRPESRWLGPVLLGAFSFSLAACSPAVISVYTEEFVRVDQSLRSGESALAHQGLDKISQNGTILERAKAGFMRCELEALESDSKFSITGDCYRQYAKSLEPELKNPELADYYALAFYRFYVDQPMERRLLGFMRLSLQCPGTPAGLKAINYLKGYWSQFPPSQRVKAWQGWDQRVYDEKVAQCSPDTKSTQIVATVALERARAYLDLDQPQAALRIFESVWPALGQSVWWDDIAIVRADAFQQAGNAEQALAVLQLFIERRESSFFIGSYESIFFDEALMMRGKILNSMGKIREARKAYLELIAQVPDSRLCDDAAYQSAILAKGTRKAAELKQFLEDYPESRWVRRAQAVVKP